MSTQKPFVRLESWAVVAGTKRGAYEELRPGNLLLGTAFGHQRIKTGMVIFTSPIVHVDLEQKIAETRNTSYQLGEPSAEYIAWSRNREVAA
jgi:hypothetical protein